MNPSTHDRSERRRDNHCGQRTVLQQRGRQSVRSEATEVDDDVNINLAQPVQGLGEVFPYTAEVHRAARLREARQEEPASLLLSRERQRLVENSLPKRTTVAVRFGHPQQAFAVGGSTGQIVSQNCLMRSGIAVCEQDRPWPGEGETDSQGGDSR